MCYIKVLQEAWCFIEISLTQKKKNYKVEVITVSE